MSFLRPARTGFRMARQRSCRCLHLQGHCRNSAHQLTEISLSAKPHNRTSYRRIGIDVRFAAFYRHRHDGRKGEAKRSHTIKKKFKTEERRVGKECVSTFRSRGWAYH